jgi:hypothetical protein
MIKDDTTSRGEFGEIVLSLAESYNINIANENIDIPLISDESEESKRNRLKPFVDEIWDTDVRILFLLLGPDYANPALDMFV